MRDAPARTISSFEDEKSSHFITEFVALGRKLVARSTLLARRNEGRVFAMEKRMNGLPTVRAAAIQAEPVVLDCEATVSKACALIAEAASHGAHLAVFPEPFVPTFINSSIWGRGLAQWGSERARRAWLRLWQNSVEIGDEATSKLCEAAREHGVTVAIGVHEREPNTRTLYNAVLFIGSDGAILGKHRKLVPTNAERMVHAFGDGGTLKVLETAVGKVGGLICWEYLMPLARYALYAQGEQIHVAPTAFDDEMGIVNARNTALEGGVFVVSCCMLLRKSSFPADFEFAEELQAAGDFPLAGGSCIVAPDGRLLAGPLWKEEGILYADLDLTETIQASQLFDAVGHYARPEVLGLHLNTGAHQVFTHSQGGDRAQATTNF